MRRPFASTFAVIAAATLLLTGCSAGPEADADTSAPAGGGDGVWPRTIEHDAGSTSIDTEPLRIVSTSPSITGSLLAIDAPLVATVATTPSGLTDDKGFFTQWAEVADERGVEVAYPNLELDLDAIDLLEPDLIIGSVNGGDSTADAYEQLSDIAPTVLLDYGTETWQDLATQLGEITGHEEDAAATLAEYDTWVAEQAEAITLPEQPATALVYMGADGVWAFGEESPQAELLTSLGFTYAALPEEYLAEAKAGANGVDVVTSENLAAALEGSQTIFTVAMSAGDPVAAFVADPLAANLPAVTGNRVHTLGAESFRLDYYSAKNTIELLVAEFGN